MYKATHILVVESNPADARLIELYLEESGLGVWEVHCAGSLGEALTLLAESEYSIVLIDLYQPDGEGVHIIQQIASKHPGQNIIALIGQDERMLGLDAIRAGAMDYLVKGDYDETSLARTLRFSLEHKHMIQRLEETQAAARIGSWEYWPERSLLQTSTQLHELFGQKPEQSLPSPVLSMLDRIHRVVLAGRHVNLDTKFEMAPGPQRYFHVKCNTSSSADGEPFLQGILQDVTERYLSEEMRKSRDLAQRSAEMREQFIASISHEMRTPISAILGLSDLLLGESMSADQRGMVQSIRDTSQILLGIVNDILDYREMQVGKIKFRNEPFSLPDLCRNLAQILAARIQDNGLTWSMTLDPAIPAALTGDKLRMNQVLLNLVGNAIKFTLEGGIHLTVKVIKSDTESATFEIAVQDTGIGIEPDQLPYIFEDFNRGRHRYIQQEGSGLGLAITRRLIEQQGGSINAESVPGKGSTFRVVLTLRKAAIEVIHSSAGQPGMGSDQQFHGAILVVEDHRLNQVVARKTLENRWPEAQILLAEHGQEALDIIEKHPLDIVLMDLYMPFMDGYAAARAIRRHPRDEIAQIPIIAMTANAFAANDETLRSCGFNAVILKPFDPEQLFQAILHFATAKTH